MKDPRWLRFRPILQILAFALLFAAAFIGGRYLPRAVQPVQAVAPLVMQGDIETTATYSCTVMNIGVFNTPAPGRVHIRCTVPAGAIAYFAVSGSNAGDAARFLSTFSTAFALGKPVLVYYDTTANGTAWGCNASDCRPIWGATVGP